MTGKEKSMLMRSYVIGFGLSLLLTIISFGIVWWHEETNHAQPSHGVILGALAVFASLQLAVQVVYFLHVSTERKARWSALSAGFTAAMVLIVVVGSIWVMQNLNYNMMPHDVIKYVQDEELIH